jgi:hypothetical protein
MHRLNRSETTTQPAHGAGQGNVVPPQRVSGGLYALGRERRGDGVFDRSQQAWHPGGKEVRQQAECSMALWTIPARDAQTSRPYARIAAVASKGAAARRMQGAARQAGIMPCLVGDVRLDARQRP